MLYVKTVKADIMNWYRDKYMEVAPREIYVILSKNKTHNPKILHY